MLCSMLSKLRNGYIGGTWKAPYPLSYVIHSRNFFFPFLGSDTAVLEVILCFPESET